jgi:hypothetical protein
MDLDGFVSSLIDRVGSQLTVDDHYYLQKYGVNTVSMRLYATGYTIDTGPHNDVLFITKYPPEATIDWDKLKRIHERSKRETNGFYEDLTYWENIYYMLLYNTARTFPDRSVPLRDKENKHNYLVKTLIPPHWSGDWGR